MWCGVARGRAMVRGTQVQKGVETMMTTTVAKAGTYRIAQIGRLPMLVELRKGDPILTVDLNISTVAMLCDVDSDDLLDTWRSENGYEVERSFYLEWIDMLRDFYTRKW
jgi:hypothetical protein